MLNDMVDELARLFRYEMWANRLVFESLQQPDTPDHATALFSHILAGQEIWLTRLRGQDSSSVPVWPEPSLAECGQALERLEPAVEAYLATLREDESRQKIAYLTQTNEPWEHTPYEILTHLAFHSHYHRGQIATRLRDAGLTPNNTDFIQYLRTGG